MTWKEFSDPNRIDQQASQKLVGNITDGYSFVDPIKYAAQLKTERKTNMGFANGDRVMVGYNSDEYNGKFRRTFGEVKFGYAKESKIAVEIDYITNKGSRYGYFYFAPEHLIKVPNDKKQNLEDYTMNSHEDINTAMYRARINTTYGIPKVPGIKNVIFNAPATIVFWADGTKTIVKCGPNDIYDPEKGLAIAIAKKHFGNDNCFHRIFKQWLPKEEEK